MSSKTPQFDTAIGAILDALKPHDAICNSCKTGFSITKDDIKMYKRFRVPPPTLCWVCRMQRRAATSLRLPPFYRKACFAPGHTEEPITLFPKYSPHKIYDNQYWRSDAWDELSYGRDYDSGRSFFEQFGKLFLDVPHQAIFVDPTNINSEYAIGGANSSDCYYVSVPMHSENVMYGFLPMHTRDSTDVSNTENSELLYECVNVSESYNCNYSMEITKCRDSWFLYDCKNCENCFMSSNLRNKSHYFCNEQLTKKEYEKRIRSVGLERRSVLEHYKKEFDSLREKAIHRAVNTRNVVDSVGDRISDCTHCYYVFEAHEGCENMRYVESAVAGKDMMDVYGMAKTEVAYESVSLSGSSNILFSGNIRFSTFMEYSQYCRDSHYCFGSVGLKSKRFCIFNKQYSEDAYWRAVDVIKTAMLERKEYGEYMPTGSAPYQNTLAQIEFPLTKKEAEKQNIQWYDDEEHHLTQDIEILKSHEIPDRISEVKDDILQKGIQCAISGKTFRVVKTELDFYRTKNLPLPVRHPDIRMRRRFDAVNRFRLWDAVCACCKKKILTSYSPAQSLTIWCESCYLKEIG